MYQIQKINNRIKNCQYNFRCGLSYSCKKCGETKRKKEYATFSKTKIPNSEDNIITYIVIKNFKNLSLFDGLEAVYSFINELKKISKRKKFNDIYFYGKIEVSLKDICFNPHINLLVWGDIAQIKELAITYNMSFWSKSKDINVSSIVWYMLKFNDLGIEAGEAVRRAINKRSTIMTNIKLNKSDDDYINDLMHTVFINNKTYEIKSKEELELESKRRARLRKDRARHKKKIEKAHNSLLAKINDRLHNLLGD